MRATTVVLGAALLLGGCLLLAAAAEASHEGWGTYEDWTTRPTIRSDRWQASVDFVQERRLEIRREKLRMRVRKAGATGSDVGLGFFSTRMLAANPTAIDQIEVLVKVTSLTLIGCPANPLPSFGRPAGMDLIRFNDVPGPPAPNDRTGDHVARVIAEGNSNAPGVMDILASIFRCANPACSAQTAVAFAQLPRRAVGDRFRVRLVWDPPGNRFLVGLDDDPDVALGYPPAANARPANVPQAVVRLEQVPANCTVPSGGPTVTDAESRVYRVRTNASAVIP